MYVEITEVFIEQGIIFLKYEKVEIKSKQTWNRNNFWCPTHTSFGELFNINFIRS
jgi:hypothetical protein